MPRKTSTTELVRTVGLVSSFVAAAAVGLTLVADNGPSVFGGWVPRSERLFLLVLAIGVFLLHLVLRLMSRCQRGRTGQNSQE